MSLVVLVVYGGLLCLTYWGFMKSPAGFIPMQDKGYLLVNVQLPDAASVERTAGVSCSHIEQHCPRKPRASSTPWPWPGSRSCWGPTRRTSAPCT